MPGLTLKAIRDDGRLEALAEAFARREDADELLDEIGFPAVRRPPFGQPLHFWRAVCQEIQNGLTAGGLEALLTAAGSLRKGHARLGRAPIRVLFVSATPANTDVVQVGREWQVLQTIASSSRPVPLQLEQRLSVNDEQLFSAITSVQPTILHFSGHGVQQGHLVLQDEKDRPVYLSLRALGEAIRIVCQQSPVRLVVLNACYAADAAEKLWPHAEALVGSEQALRDQLAVVFARRFYETLTDDRQSLASAYEAGRWSMRQHLEANPELEERFRSVVPRPRAKEEAPQAVRDWVGEQVVLRARPGVMPGDWYLGGR